jgi:hypothetical protein
VVKKFGKKYDVERPNVFDPTQRIKINTLLLKTAALNIVKHPFSAHLIKLTVRGTS